MNDALGLPRITRLVPVPSGMTENEAGDRGEWPVIAFTDDVRPIVFEFNLN